MKTIFIILSGIADCPDVESGGKTPLMLASTPSLDALTKCGCYGSVKTIPDEVPLTRENALLSLLGYDLKKGTPDPVALERFGRSSSLCADDPEIGYFIMPKFSCHGVVISFDPVVRGIGKMALLKPVDYPEMRDGEDSILRAKGKMALKAIDDNEFVLLHVECAAAMSRKRDLKGKMEAIERIDREIITPIADYVWNADVQMNMVVVSECIVSWRSGRNERGDVPAVVYFNDDMPYDSDGFDEESVSDGPLNAPLPGDLIRKLVTFEPFVQEENDDF